jgi:hypothetical protein
LNYPIKKHKIGESSLNNTIIGIYQTIVYLCINMRNEELNTELSKLKRIKTLATLAGYTSHESMRLLIKQHNAISVLIDGEAFYNIEDLPYPIKQRIAQGRLRAVKKRKGV